jgi:SulP family sulfate permease
VGGIVVGIASGSALGVSGPAAGLAVIVLTSIASLGSWTTFLLAVVIAGVIQLIMGFIKAGFIAYFFPVLCYQRHAHRHWSTDHHQANTTCLRL